MQAFGFINGLMLVDDAQAGAANFNFRTAANNHLSRRVSGGLEMTSLENFNAVEALQVSHLPAIVDKV